MGLTRKALSAMGIEAEKIDQIIEMHTEVVDAIKTERDTAQEDAKKYKADSDKLADVQKELNDLKADKSNPDEYEKKYNDLKSEYETYKNDMAAKESKAAKSEAYKAMLKDIGVSEKRFDSILRIANLDSIELEDGKIKGIDELKEKAKDEWSDFIVSETKKGADTATPPDSVGGGKMTKEQIMSIKDTAARQRAMAENPEMFGI